MSSDNEKQREYEAKTQPNPEENEASMMPAAQETSETADDSDEVTIPDPWKQRYDALPKETQKKLQFISGAVVALLVGALLFLFDNPETRQTGGILPSWNLIIALGLVLVLPRIFENKLGTSLQVFRKVLLFGLLIVVVAMTVVALVNGNL